MLCACWQFLGKDREFLLYICRLVFIYACLLGNISWVSYENIYTYCCLTRAPKKPKLVVAAAAASVVCVVVSVEVLSAHYKFTGIQFIAATIRRKPSLWLSILRQRLSNLSSAVKNALAKTFQLRSIPFRAEHSFELSDSWQSACCWLSLKWRVRQMRVRVTVRVESNWV